MNIEAWQAQQKALKDAERQNKTQAAEALRSYRRDGLSSEEKKLSEIREQERKKKLEAEDKLRGYRGGLREEDTKLSALREEERRKKQEAEQRNRGYGLSGNKEPEMEAATASNIEKDDPSSALEPGAVSALAGKFTIPNQPTAVGHGEAILPVGIDNSSTQQQMFQTPAVIKENLSFKFGLISADAIPAYDAYMTSIDNLVTNTLGQDMKQSLTFEYPVVASIENDESYMDPAGRQEVTRRVVTVSMSFSTSLTNADGEEIKARIIESMRTAIASGSFKKS